MGFTNWVTHVRAIFAKYNLEYLMYNQSNSLPLCGYKNIKPHVLSKYEIFFMSLIQNMDKYPKLRAYKNIKLTFQCEPYLNCRSQNLVCLCKFRTSFHRLEIERGRYTVPKMPIELCIRKLCDQNLVEDETHFVTVCEKYMPLSIDLHTITESVFQGFRCMSSREQFHMLLTNDDDNVMFALA